MGFSDFTLPDTLCSGRYVVRHRLNTGVATVVYAGWDTVRKRHLAMKVLHPDAEPDSPYHDRFMREARLLDRLRHPNVVRVFDTHVLPDHRFFTMELASQGDLSNYLRKHGAISSLESLMAGFAVLRALDFAHRHNVIHRDIKPTNVLVANRLDAVKITDFGIARDETGTALTHAGDALGTVAYMAPEQAEDPRAAGPYSDVYSVGAMLYLLLSGRSPIDIADVALDDAALAHVPEAARALVERAVQPEPSARYQTARDMANAVASAWMAFTEEEAAHKPRITALDDLAAPTTMDIDAGNDWEDAPGGFEIT